MKARLGLKLRAELLKQLLLSPCRAKPKAAAVITIVIVLVTVIVKVIVLVTVIVKVIVIVTVSRNKISINRNTANYSNTAQS